MARKTLTSVLTGLFAGLMLATNLLAPAQAAMAVIDVKGIGEMQKQLANMKEQLGTLKSQLDTAKESLSVVTDQLKAVREVKGIADETLSSIGEIGNLSIPSLNFQSLASSTFGLHGFLMFNRLQGGNETNVEPGFKAWPKTVGPNVLEYIASSAKISEMVQTGEAALFPLTPTQVTALKLKGIPVEYAPPKEGAVVLNVAECTIANNDQPELAQKLAAFLLTPEAQAPALEMGDQIPSNPKTPTSDRTRGQVEAMNKYLETAVTIDWDQVNQIRPEWNAHWSRTIER